MTQLSARREMSGSQEERLARERRIVEQENIVFEHARETGQISPQQYEQAKAAQKARLSDQVGVSPSARPSPQTTAYLASKTFYEKAGYPQYSGRYAAPDIPGGQEVYEIKETPEKQLLFTLGPKIDYVYDIPSGVSGPVLFEPRKPTSEEKKQLQERYLRGEDISAGAVVEQRALSGLALSTGVLAPIVTAPTLAWGAATVAGAVGVPAAAEAVKVTTTGEHLTPYEAVGWSAVGVGGVLVARSALQSPLVRGRVQARIDAAYERQYRFNEAVLKGEVKGVVEPWKPTGWQKTAMRMTGASPKQFAPQVNVARVPGGDVPFGMAEFQRVKSAEDLFDWGFVPKSAMQTRNIPVTQTAAATAASKYPLFYGRGMEFLTKTEYFTLKHEITRAEMAQNEAWKAANQGIPESQFAYDYRGSLGFEKYPLQMEYAEGKTVGYTWTPPYQQAPLIRVGMKPLWESIGSTPKTPTIFTSRPITVTEIAKTTMATGGAGYYAPDTVSAITRQAAHPFMWQGQSYYRTKGRAATEETVYLSYPASKLGHPEKMGETFDLDVALGLNLGQIAGARARQKLRLGQAALLSFDTNTLLEETTPPFHFDRAPTTPAFFDIGGFKFEGAGFTTPSLLRLQKARGRKRIYPILTGKEVLKLW